MNAEPSLGVEPIRPAVPQITQPRGLTLAADRIVKGQRFGNGVVIGGRVGADLLEFADVLGARRAGRRQRPQSLDVFPSDVEKPRADRREQPFVQTGAVVIAAQVGGLVREVRERMNLLYYRF